MDEKKKQALQVALGQIEKQYGKGSVMFLGDEEARSDIEAVSTGSLSLDIALGIGGLPRGRVVEIYGPESSGKSTLALSLSQKLECEVCEEHSRKYLEKKKHYDIEEIYTPFPVHGLDKVMGLEPTRIAIAAFIYGCIGIAVATLMMNYIMIVDWPQNIGGKPSFAYYLNMPAFVPIIFEMTVLFSAHLMVITYFFKSKLFPGQKATNPDVRTTDDKCLMEIESDDDKAISSILKETGATEITVKDMD